MVSNVTRGGLVKAKLINLTTKEEVPCMFNPHEYTLKKTNNWEANENIGKNTPLATFTQGGSQVLSLVLHFDTLGNTEGPDVRAHTDPLWKMMMVDENNRNSKSGKGAPPEVAFEWGRLYFRAVITNMTQKFTLFKEDGTPVRCEVNITLEQKVDVDDYKDDDSPVGQLKGAAEEVVAKAGERIDNITQGDAGKMRKVMEDNNIDNPLSLPPGSKINIRL